MLNYAKLVSSGRAKAHGVCWTAEELELVYSITHDRHTALTVAADFVRNGVESLEDYDKAVKKDFKPLTVDEAKEKAEKDLKNESKKVVKQAKSKRKK